jgi:cysteine desulfurase
MHPNGLEPVIYLDYAATTPVDERVLQAMLPYFGTIFGNAASQHCMGRAAAEAVQRAREQLAVLVNCSPDEVIWTSGATEANNLAIKGVIRAIGSPAPHVITQAIEHKAVLDPLNALSKDGVIVTVLDVDSAGFLRPESVEKAILPETVLVTLMAANNELGTLTPIGKIGEICQKAGILLHTDASQATGKIPVDMQADHLDLLSVSGHKLYGPKGIGALAFRRGSKLKRLTPIIDGGGHERGMRSGTLNVPAIVGLGRACEIARLEMGEESERIRSLQDDFEAGLMSRLPNTLINGSGSQRLPNISNVAFMGVDAESLLLALDRIAASTGSACTAASIEPSHVLKALKLPDDRQRCSVRFSFGRQSTSDEVREALDLIHQTVHILRGLADAPLI